MFQSMWIMQSLILYTWSLYFPKDISFASSDLRQQKAALWFPGAVNSSVGPDPSEGNSFWSQLFAAISVSNPCLQVSNSKISFPCKSIDFLVKFPFPMHSHLPLRECYLYVCYLQVSFCLIPGNLFSFFMLIYKLNI